MSDDKNKQDFRDRDRISTSEEYEVIYWAEKFGVDEAELKRAVEKTSPMVKDVQEYLKSK